jgi:murein DD-endopeptidase MepM/ murein hydrolase activator NlpD
MRLFLLAFLLLPFSISFSQLSDNVIRELKSGRAINDNSYIYCLPWAAGKKQLLVQAYNSKMSHKGELSLDFKMKPGSIICAAREGVVVAVKKDSDAGGLKDEYLSQGNHIIIEHDDGSKAFYWHLQKTEP